MRSNVRKYLNIISLMALLMPIFSHAGEAEKLIYQSSSNIEAALRFVGVPNDKVSLFENAVVKGHLADKNLIKIANRLVDAREKRNAKLIEGIVSKESLSKPSRELDEVRQQIKDGTLIYGEGLRYFVTKASFSQKLVDYNFRNNVKKPSFVLYLNHYDPKKNILIGSPLYIAEVGGAYKIVFPVQ